MAFFGGCAIKDGTIECWGDWEGHAGSLAGGPPAGTFTDIAADIYHYCAINSSGGVECWGNNDYGQSSPPSGSNFTQLAAGNYHTCGLKTDGTVECWGVGTLANPTAGFPGADCNPLQHPKSFECGQAALPAGTYTQITSGSIYHSCGIKTDGTAVCSGQNGTWGGGSPSWILDDMGLCGWCACGRAVRRWQHIRWRQLFVVLPNHRPCGAADDHAVDAPCFCCPSSDCRAQGNRLQEAGMMRRLALLFGLFALPINAYPRV